MTIQMSWVKYRRSYSGIWSILIWARWQWWLVCVSMTWSNGAKALLWICRRVLSCNHYHTQRCMVLARWAQLSTMRIVDFSSKIIFFVKNTREKSSTHRFMWRTLHWLFNMNTPDMESPCNWSRRCLFEPKWTIIQRRWCRVAFYSPMWKPIQIQPLLVWDEQMKRPDIGSMVFR